jgi:hypothetical protein
VSKKFINKKCVYCNQGDSTRTGDHVFPRALFLVNRRSNFPKVPCCTKCNNQKSLLEVNLLATLPFGANHSDAIENLTTNVPRRLENNIKLHRKLQASRTQTFIKNNNGILEPRLTIDIDREQLFELFNYITKALAYFHFNIRINSNHSVKSLNANPTLANFFNGAAQNHIVQDLGNGTVWYRGIQATDNQFLTMWEYRIHGGLHFLGQLSGNINSYTCRTEVQHRVDLRIKFGMS